MAGADTVLGLAHRFYEAVEDPSALPEALGALAQAAGAYHAVTASRSLTDGRWSTALGNIDPELGDRLACTLESDAVRLWLSRIPRAGWDRMCAMVPTKTPLSRALYDSQFYADFVEPMGGHHAALTAMDLGEGRSFLSVFRPERLGDYDPDAMRLLESVRPHLARAFRLGQRLAYMTGAAHAGFGMLERLQAGVVLLDRRLQLLFANRAAFAIASRSEEMTLDGQGLRLTQAGPARRLHALLAQAAADVVPPDGAPRLTVPQQASAYPLLLHVERLQVPGLALAGAHVGVFIDDPAAVLAVETEDLVAVFGLTPREATLAVILAGGATPRQAAFDLGMSEATAKTHLKRILDKTGAHRQAELVGLVTTLARR